MKWRKLRTTGVLTFSANWDWAEGTLLAQGSSSTASNSVLEVGNVEYVEYVAPDLPVVLVVVGLNLRDLL
jgi:hypothetical protein